MPFVGPPCNKNNSSIQQSWLFILKKQKLQPIKSNSSRKIVLSYLTFDISVNVTVIESKSNSSLYSQILLTDLCCGGYQLHTTNLETFLPPSWSFAMVRVSQLYIRLKTFLPVSYLTKPLKKNRILFTVTLSGEEFSFFDIEFTAALNSDLIYTIFWYYNSNKNLLTLLWFLWKHNSH